MKTTLSALIKLAVETRCIASLLVLAIAFAGCEKSDNNDPDTPTGPGTITFTAVPDSYNNEIDFAATARQLVIDWGDGSAPETYTNVDNYFDDRYSLKDNSDEIVHTYAEGNATYTVHIKEEGLTYFDVDVYNIGRFLSLTVRGCTALQVLDCRHSQLTSLDVSQCPALQHLDCKSNQLTTLDVSKCPALWGLYCDSNQLTSLDVTKCTALGGLECTHNQLTSLDVTKCPALEWLECNHNQLTSLDVTKCPALEWLKCESNQLTSLDVTKCPALRSLYCGSNQLTTLDVTKCPALKWLACGANPLTSLDVTHCPALQDLYCYSNQLTSLDVSKCPALQELGCYDNQLTATALDAVFTALPNCYGHISISNNPGANSCDRAIAENKGWYFYQL
jgi:Leucine-rich repeat (LRR) protein